MEAKRRKLDDPATPSGSVAVSLTDKLTSESETEVMTALFSLKKKLAAKEAVLQFLDEQKHTFRQLVQLLHKACSRALGPSDSAPRKPVLKEVLSVLANICHYSLTACVEMKQNYVQLPHYAMRILESGERTDSTTKSTVLRLLGNVCAFRETAPLVTSNPIGLLDRIVMSMVHEDQAVAEKAIRVVRLLSRISGSAKAIIRSNGGFYLGTLLSSGDHQRPETLHADLLEMLTMLLRFCPRDLCRQLATTNCSAVLLELLLLPAADDASLEATRSRWRNFVLKLSKHSHELREQFGQEAIYRVLELDSLPIYLCDFLCYFSLEAWSRSVLRESGALKKILERFAASEDAAERATIITGLKNFEHDNQTMSYLCQSSQFLDVALRMLRDYAEERKVACTVEYANPDEEALLYRADSPFAQELEQRLQAEADSTEGQEEQLHKTFFGSESPPTAGPSSSPIHNIWSPSVSPTSAQSPALSPSSSYGSLLSDLFGFDDDSNGAISPARDSDQAGTDGGMQDGRRSRQLSTTEEENEISERRQELMINDLSHIISWQTHQDEANFVNLIKASVLQTLVDFISDAPTFNERMARSVMRLTRSRRLLEELLDMNFHMMVLLKLVRRDCIQARGSKFCFRCDKRRHFGRDVLREFIDHVDSMYGISFLNLRLESADHGVKENALIAGLVLLRNQTRKQRFYHNYMPLETLLSKMHAILMTHSCSEETPEFSSEEEDFFVNVVASFSTLLSRRSLMGLVELSDSSGSAPSAEKQAAECRVSNLEEGVATLEFTNKEGQVIVAVPKEEVLASSAYFRGMFENEFIERVESRQTFMFDDAVEMCGQNDFIRFLHYLSGCRGECTKIVSVETCVALLHLSDKYICSELQSELLRAQGPVRRMVRGDTLRFFLPLVMTVPLLRTELSNLCALVLLRYSNREELMATLKEMAKHPVGIDALLELLKDFLTASCNNDRFAPSDAARFLDF